VLQSQKQRAIDFRSLHHSQHILVLPNAWDVASARIFEEAGFHSVATSSGGVAASLEDVATMNVYLKDIRDLDRFSQVRKEFFKHDPPTSTAVQVSAFAEPEGLVEVSAMSVLT
jgi:enamine deaminase RidA (YjgF/YER057c/UK114 family)